MQFATCYNCHSFMKVAPVLPPAICLTEQRPSPYEHVPGKWMFFDLDWMYSNPITIVGGSKLCDTKFSWFDLYFFFFFLLNAESTVMFGSILFRCTVTWINIKGLILVCLYLCRLYLGKWPWKWCSGLFRPIPTAPPNCKTVWELKEKILFDFTCILHIRENKM